MAKHKDTQKKEKQTSEVEEKVLYINRCSKVVKGGRKFSFSALILAHDANGRLGIGFAKANELTDAIRKGGESARKGMKSYSKHGTTVPHEVLAKKDGGEVYIQPAPKGSGVVAGSLIRSILEAAGVKDVMAKSLGSNNPLNQAKATFKALETLKDREQIKQERGVV